MTTKGVADIVFCLDASDSMRPCFEGVRNHIAEFIAALDSNRQIQWDWRIDFVAHCSGGDAFRSESMFYPSGDMIDALYHRTDDGSFFTSDLEQFRRALARVEVFGDEASLIALDCCLDFPFRMATRCHRVVVMMTDEPFETGTLVEEQKQMLPTLIEKIQRQRIMLQLVAPESEVYGELSAVDKGVYEVTDRQGDGLAGVDFRQVLMEIGKSVSVCDWQMNPPQAVPRGIFGQPRWGSGGSMPMHDRT